MFGELLRYAARENLVHPGGYIERRCDFRVVVDPQGCWLRGGRIVNTGTSREATFFGPTEVLRSSNIVPGLGVDSVTYVFGYSVKPNKNTKGSSPAFLSLMKSAAEGTNHPHVRAVAKFLGDVQNGKYGTPIEAVTKCLGDPEVKGSEWVILAVDDGESCVDVHDVPAMRNWIEAKASVDNSIPGMRAACLITGQVGPVARVHGKIKNLPGCTAGVPCVSFKEDAYRSRGLQQGANATVSLDSELLYRAGLNDMLMPEEMKRIVIGKKGSKEVVYSKPRHGVYVDGAKDGMALLCWTKEKTSDLPVRRAVEQILEGKFDALSVEDLALTPTRGGSVSEVDENAYCALLVSARNKRMVVHAWMHDAIPRLKENVLKYVADLSMPSRAWPCSIRTWLQILKPRDKYIYPKEVTGSLIRCAMQGGPVHDLLVSMALSWFMAVPGDSEERARWEYNSKHVVTLLKLALIRKGRNIMTDVDENRPLDHLLNNMGDLNVPRLIGFMWAQAIDTQSKAVQFPRGPQRSTVLRADLMLNPCKAIPDISRLFDVHVNKLRCSSRGIDQRTGNAANSRMTKILHQIADSGGVPHRMFGKWEQAEVVVGRGQYDCVLEMQRAIETAKRETAKRDCVESPL